MEELPRVSVIIPSFNHGEYLPEAIASVRAVAYPNYEIIIVDDGSTDKHSKQVALQYAHDADCVVICQENKGVAASRNMAIMRATGKYIIPLDADNKILSTYFYEGVQILEQYPEVGVVYGDARIFGEKQGTWRNHDLQLEEILFENYIDNCAIFRKACWEKVGGYDEHAPFHTREDWFFWLALLDADYQFKYLPKFCFEYRFLQNSKVRTHAATMQRKLTISEYIYPKQVHLIQKFNRAGKIDNPTAQRLLHKLSSQLAYYHLNFGKPWRGYQYLIKSINSQADWMNLLKIAVYWPFKRYLIKA